ncbi:MAG TPA: phytanoyl-CoA dioxygenase family protein [Chitinophagales bacterium]|nr:phytanoyl-CoA dioxygenase family protein [Chitinophagales bacterium]
MERNVLHNKSLNDELQKNGFVKLHVLDNVALQQAYKQIVEVSGSINFSGHQNQNVDVPYHSTFFENSVAYKQAIYDVITELFVPVFTNHVDNYKIIQASIFNKPPGSGYVCPHQNLTTVDETRFMSISVWAPLQPTDSTNGTLYFAPGSHKKFSKYRNHNIGWEPLKVLESIEDYNMVPVNLNVGEVLIFDDSIVHASPVNNSDTNRIVFHCLALPQEAHAVYCKKLNDEIEVIEVEDHFWRYFTPGASEPESPVIKRVKNVSEKYSPTSILSELRT